MSVAPTRGPVQRPGEDRDFTEIFQRLDDLERALSGSGWQFNVDNEGGWGYVVANDSTDLSPGGEVGMQIGEQTGEGTFVFSQDHSDSARIGSLKITPDEIRLHLSVSMFIKMDRAAGQISLEGPGGPILRVDDDETVHIKTGQSIIADL